MSSFSGLLTQSRFQILRSIRKKHTYPAGKVRYVPVCPQASPPTASVCYRGQVQAVLPDARGEEGAKRGAIGFFALFAHTPRQLKKVSRA